MNEQQTKILLWLNTEQDIARVRTYPYSNEYKLNDTIKLQVTNFSLTDNNIHKYICIKPEDSIVYLKVDLSEMPNDAIVQHTNTAIADCHLYGNSHCLERLKVAGFKVYSC